jgi:hypothetical protein
MKISGITNQHIVRDIVRDATYPVISDGIINQRRSGNNIPHIELLTKPLSFCPQKDLVRKPYSIILLHPFIQFFAP